MIFVWIRKFLWKPNYLFDKMLILFVQVLVIKENDFTFYNGIRLSKHVYNEKNTILFNYICNRSFPSLKYI